MVVAFSREHGLLRGVAKGARRLGSNFAGGFEALTLGDIVFSTAAWEKQQKVSNTSGSGLLNITAWEVLELFPAGRSSLRHFLACCCMLDLVQRGMQEADPHPGVFDALVRALREMQSPADVVGGGAGSGATTRAAQLAPILSPEAGLARVAWTLLHQTGHAPDVSVDIMHAGPLAPAKVYTFFPRLGGFTTQPTAGAEEDARPGPAWRVRGETLLALRALAMPAALAANTSDAAVWTRAASLLVQYFREVHQTDVPAVGEWLKGVKG